MSYSAQQAMLENESLLSEWGKDLQYVIDGEEEEAIVYKGPVTGLSHHHYSEFEKQLKVGDYLLVKSDLKNPYDKNATGLFIGDKQIGWIPKAMNSVAAKAVRLKCHFVARIIRHKEFNGDFTNLLFVEVSAAQKEAWAAELQRKIDAAPTSTIFKSQEQDTMATKMNTVIEKNITLGTNAAFLEAGRIANNQLSGIAAKKLPIMVRGYADTALGRLVLANIAMMAAEHFRPGDARLERLAKAMTTTAYQEVLQQFDIEEMIEGMLSNKTIAKALKAVDVDPA